MNRSWKKSNTPPFIFVWVIKVQQTVCKEEMKWNSQWVNDSVKKAWIKYSKVAFVLSLQCSNLTIYKKHVSNKIKFSHVFRRCAIYQTVGKLVSEWVCLWKMNGKLGIPFPAYKTSLLWAYYAWACMCLLNASFLIKFYS